MGAGGDVSHQYGSFFGAVGVSVWAVEGERGAAGIGRGDCGYADDVSGDAGHGSGGGVCADDAGSGWGPDS